MTYDLPLKTQMFVKTLEAGSTGVWENDVIEAVLKADRKDDMYWRNVAKFWFIEFMTNGVVSFVEEKADSEFFGRETIVTKYKITDLGIDRKNSMLG
jgi:hypothetical protein